MRLERRQATSRSALLLAPIGAVAFTMLVSALLVLWAGAPVGRTYALLVQGGFGSVFAWSETLTRAIPLILTYLDTGLVPRLPTAILVTGMVIVGVLSFFAGLILDTVTRGRREMRRLAYLAHPAPTVAQK